MLVALPLLASCGGGGGEEGNGGGGGNDGGGQGGQAGGGGGDQGGGTGGNQPPISDVRAIFATPDRTTLNGQRARIRDAEVREVVSERAFYVGENDAERLLVLNVSEEATEVSEGQSVLVAGRLNTPRPELEDRLSLSPEEASAIEEEGLFLRASQVRPEDG